MAPERGSETPGSAPSTSGSADSSPSPDPSLGPSAVRGVLETCVYADDLDAAEAFYGGVLGMTRIVRVPGRHVFFRCGAGVFLVFNPARTSGPGGELPPHGTRGATHVCFAVGEDEMEGWRARLREAGVEVEAETEWPGGGRSMYLRDPAGNSVELGTPRIWGIEEFGAAAS